MNPPYTPPPDLAAANAVTEAGQEWLKFECRTVSDEELAAAEEYASRARAEYADLSDGLANRLAAGRLGVLRLVRATAQFLGLEAKHSWAAAFLVGVLAVACVAPVVLLFRPAGGTGVFIFLLTYATAVLVVLSLLFSTRRDGVSAAIDRARTQRDLRRARAADLVGEIASAEESLQYLRAARAAQDRHEHATRAYERVTEQLAAERHQIARTNWRDMRGLPFENFVARVFRMLGYEVRKARGTAEHGVDLIVTGQGRTIAVQTWGHDDGVGVQEVKLALDGRKAAGCEEFAVVTNGPFTTDAVSLAAGVNCALVDGDRIPDLIAGRVF